jgi:gamma-D-glutamyl-L-lysine dipeptidyl-peptidase
VILPTILAFALSVAPNTGHVRGHSTPAQITRTAKHYLGKTYVYGDAGPIAFDCSGLVQTIFRAHGVTLPRTSREQSLWGRPVDLQEIKPGDLLFFSLRPSTYRITHVAIALDHDRMIHASRFYKRVVISKFDTPYFQDRLRVARRLGD